MENICIKNETKIVDFAYSHRRGGNLQHCKGEKQKRHFINFIMNFNEFSSRFFERSEGFFQKISMWAKNLAFKPSKDKTNMYLVANFCLLLSYLCKGKILYIHPVVGRRSTPTLIFLLFSK